MQTDLCANLEQNTVRDTRVTEVWKTHCPPNQGLRNIKAKVHGSNHQHSPWLWHFHSPGHHFISHSSNIATGSYWPLTFNCKSKILQANLSPVHRPGFFIKTQWLAGPSSQGSVLLICWGILILFNFRIWVFSPSFPQFEINSLKQRFL